MDDTQVEEADFEPEAALEELIDTEPAEIAAVPVADEDAEYEAPKDTVAGTALAAVPSDDDLYTLLKALLIKVQVSEDAKKTLVKIQELLVR